jgi:hypothetical protein
MFGVSIRQLRLLAYRVLRVDVSERRCFCRVYLPIKNVNLPMDEASSLTLS